MAVPGSVEAAAGVSSRVEEPLLLSAAAEVSSRRVLGKTTAVSTVEGETAKTEGRAEMSTGGGARVSTPIGGWAAC